MKIRKGDTVKIVTGQDQGKKGKVLQVYPNQNKLTIEGLNLQIKHTRPKKEGEKGQKIQYPAPLDISNIKIVCPKCNKPSRIGFKKLADQKKMRRCTKCNELF